MGSSPLIAIRATPLLFEAAGVAQYIRSLAQELVKRGEHVALFTPLKWGIEPSQLPPPRGSASGLRKLILSSIPRPRAAVRVVESALLALNSRRYDVALYHEPAALPLPFHGPTVVTVHDVSWVRFPDTHPADRVGVLSRSFPRTLDRVDHIIVDSDFTRRELIQLFGTPQEKISTVPLAARGGFRPRTASECVDVLSHLGLEFRRFVLSVGTQEPRKNLETVVRAYSAMPEAYRRRFPLVLVGGMGWLNSKLEADLRPLVDRGLARLLGYVSEDTLRVLYSAAHTFVYPSLYEGFGLPPLEAMASGTPVVISNVASLPEVVGQAGIEIDPLDEEALRMALLALSDDESLWHRLAEAGLARSSTFSWARCADQTRAAYRSVLARS